MNQDNAFVIGTTHHICQDYSIGGVLCKHGDYYTIVCDGCSSSPNSDFGARILSMGTKEELKRLFLSAQLSEFIPKNCVEFAKPIIKQIGLPEESLDATTMVITSSSLGGYALSYGDGIIAVEDMSGNIYVISIEYTDGYPFYLNYLLYPERFNEWEENHDKRKVTISVISTAKTYEMIDEDMKVLGNHDFGDIHIRNERQRTFVFFNNSGKKIKYVSILSDGIKSFYELINTETSKTNSSIDYHLALSDLLSFKNFSGEFVQRRLNRFAKDCQKKNWFHSDDLSLGVIYLGD